MALYFMGVGSVMLSKVLLENVLMSSSKQMSMMEQLLLVRYIFVVFAIITVDLGKQLYRSWMLNNILKHVEHKLFLYITSLHVIVLLI